MTDTEFQVQKAGLQGQKWAKMAMFDISFTNRDAGSAATLDQKGLGHEHSTQISALPDSIRPYDR
jgi:hypothetical protein